MRHDILVDCAFRLITQITPIGFGRGIIHLVCTQNFPKNQCFLPPNYFFQKLLYISSNAASNFPKYYI